MKVKAYVLTQRDLLNDLEALELDPFRLYQVSLSTLSQLTKFKFDTLQTYDAFTEAVAPEVLGPDLEAVVKKGAREILSNADLVR